MTLMEFADEVARDASVESKVALRVIRSVYSNLTTQLDRAGVAQLPVFGKITTKELEDGKIHHTLHIRKVTA